MQIHSLKLTIQDMPDKTGKLFAAVYGTLIIDTGETAKDAEGNEKKDKEGQVIPILENINFITPLNSSRELKMCVQGLAIEALTLKDMEISKKNGQLSHYVDAVKGTAKKVTKVAEATGKRAKAGPAPIPVPRRKKK